MFYQDGGGGGEREGGGGLKVQNFTCLKSHIFK